MVDLLTKVAEAGTRLLNEDESVINLQGEGLKNFIPLGLNDVSIRLEALPGTKFFGHTDILTEARNLTDALIEKGEIQK